MKIYTAGTFTLRNPNHTDLHLEQFVHGAWLPVGYIRAVNLNKKKIVRYVTCERGLVMQDQNNNLLKTVETINNELRLVHRNAA